MRVATGRQFFTQYGTQAQQIAPALQWALMEADGSWSHSPAECDVVLLVGDAYTPAFIDAVSRLSAVRWAHTEDAGTDGPFYDAMRAQGALVTHSPGANAPEVAEFAFSLILWSAKRLGEFATQQREHRWQLLALDSLSDKTVLIIGVGAIGSHVAALAKACGMHVLGLRRSGQAVAQVDQIGTLADLPDFLPAADFVVLAVPLNEQTRNLIGAKELAMMKPTATLINVARGAMIDIPALQDALGAGRIRQACLDVLPTEPWPANSDLWDTPHLLLTPHNAWSSPLYLQRVAELWLENLRRYVRGEELLHRVN